MGKKSRGTVYYRGIKRKPKVLISGYCSTHGCSDTASGFYHGRKVCDTCGIRLQLKDKKRRNRERALLREK